MSYKQYIGKQVRMGILDEKNLTDEGAVEYKNVNVTKVDDNTMTYLDNEAERTVPINLINKIEIINGGGGEDVAPNMQPNQKEVREDVVLPNASEKQDVNKTFDRICVFTKQNTYSSGK
jgi:hypothetical protein